MTLPRFVHIETNRHGTAVLYFRRGNGPRFRLPPPGHPLFKRAYAAAMAGRKLEVVPIQNTAERRRVLVKRALHDAVAGAKARSFRSGLPFSLTSEWAWNQACEQDLRCALTGIPFFQDNQSGSLKHPYAPSLDRIVPASGYALGNVRIIVFALNVMLSDWGEGVFEFVANAYRENKAGAPLYPRTYGLGAGLVAKTTAESET